jgi:hypothetical protein
MRLRRGPRAPSEWNGGEADAAYVIGYLGVTYLPEDGTMRPERLLWGAAVFDPPEGRPLIWRYQEGQGFAIHAVMKAFCGTRESLWLSCEEAREWALHATVELEEGATSALGAFGNVGSFEHKTGGLLRPTLRSFPPPVPLAVPGEPGGLDDFELWDWDNDRPVAPGAAITTRDSIAEGKH